MTRFPSDESDASLSEIVRQSIAANLHDDLVPYLFVSRQAVAAQLRAISDSSEFAGLGEEARESLVRSLRQLDGWLADAMNVSRGILQNSHLPDFNATCWWRELQSLCDRLYPDDRRLRFTGSPIDIAADKALACYRVGGEAIRNAVRHSNAQQIVVRAAPDPSLVLLTVEDDGDGFDPSKVGEDRFGLASMRAQARQSRLELAIDSRAGGPTRVQLSGPELLGPDSEPDRPPPS